MDDLYPNPGDNLQSTDIEAWVPEPDTAKEQDAAKENAKLASSIGVVQDVMTYLEARRREYNGVDIISGANASSPAEDIKAAVLLNQHMGVELDRLLRDFRIEYAKYITEEPIT